MEIREFAEQVLFSTSLDEKLRAPASLNDETPGAAIVVPRTPGRPSNLHFKTAGSSGGEFPGTERLDQPHERGKLLHFFANHELLATELMALVLLRFPDAPAAFRRGVVQTLKDEQAHTRLYMERMRACGIEFGELPVSGYFWRAISGMENPIDYVAGLSLTFEQANLDFARHFAAGFSTIGDVDTASLLEKIYRDEIAHVAYGLKWFRRWKNPTESDWEAFCHHLKFPLSPRRAKGTARINIQGRRAAGLDTDFIDQLNVFSQSRGRTPDVFVFNPFAEGYIALGRAFTPVKHQAQLARDLENLPQFLCAQDDVVLVHRRPSVHFLSALKDTAFDIPEFIEIGETGLEKLAARKLGRLRPWAWSPDSAELLAPLMRSSNTHLSPWCPGRAELYGKAWSAAFLRKFIDATKEKFSMLCSADEVGATANSQSEAILAIQSIRARGHHKVILKQSLGLAGHNAIRLWEPEITDAQRRWIATAIEQGTIVVEPWLERMADFSVQLEMTASGLKLIGYAGLLNDLKGQFRANWAEASFRRRIPVAIKNALLSGKRNNVENDVVGQVYQLYNQLLGDLEPELRRIGHEGPLGIDAFVYQTPEGESRLKPIVEINPRYTMGRLTLELMKQVAPGSRGTFRLVTKATLRNEKHTDFPGYVSALANRNPIQFVGEPVPRIRAGTVCLNDPAVAKCCLALFEIQADSAAPTR